MHQNALSGRVPSGPDGGAYSILHAPSRIKEGGEEEMEQGEGWKSGERKGMDRQCSAWSALTPMQ